MRGRKLRWLPALAGLTALAAGAVVLWPRPERATPENFARIEEGMTRAEVEAIMGPPGDCNDGPVLIGGLTVGRVISGNPEIFDHEVCEWLTRWGYLR